MVSPLTNIKMGPKRSSIASMTAAVSSVKAMIIELIRVTAIDDNGKVRLGKVHCQKMCVRCSRNLSEIQYPPFLKSMRMVYATSHGKVAARLKLMSRNEKLKAVRATQGKYLTPLDCAKEFHGNYNKKPASGNTNVKFER
jgi:hypothetical protein